MWYAECSAKFGEGKNRFLEEMLLMDKPCQILFFFFVSV